MSSGKSAVSLLDYGVGNIGSLGAVFDALGHTALRSTSAAHIRDAGVLVLPGVGSAQTAMRELHARGLLDALRERHHAGRPIIGICLGAQLIFEFLEEASAAGIGLLSGTVARLAGSPGFHTGWSRLDWPAFQQLGIATGLKPGDTYYFNHGYALPQSAPTGCANDDTQPRFVNVEGRPQIPALLLQEHLCGIQFHPEKSQGPGRLLLRNLLRQWQ